MKKTMKKSFYPYGNGMKPFLLILVSMFLLSGQTALAKVFNVDEVVFAAFPVGNIKDDAFIVGKVKKQLKNGDYQLSVLDYVEGHDYGSSCIPMVKKEDPNATALGYEKGWEMWQDTTKLDTQNLDYVVPKENVLSLGYGKQYFVERNNLYIVFGRWKSDAPVMTLDRIERAQRESKAIGLDELIPVFDLVKYHRKVYYDTNNRPLYAFERVQPAIEMLEKVQMIFDENLEFAKKWRAKERDWKQIGLSSYDYFMVEAVDKALFDAEDLLYEEGIENAGVDKVENLKELVKKLKRVF